MYPHSAMRYARSPFAVNSLALCVAIGLSGTVHAEEEAPDGQKASDALFEKIEVTARKKVESIQDVPVSLTAFNESQLDALKFRDMNDLSVGMANVVMDDVGTARGVANFSIRGLGINSSIPSIDPTVGVFVDGVYMGTNGGVITDMFDIERIEVLRGPQGILFGRNVTGGAVLITTKKPEDTVAGKVKASVTGGGPGGLNKTVQGSVSIPISDTLSTKLAVYYNDDDGWFKNKYDGSDHGAIEQTMIRSTTWWAPTEDLEFVLKYENYSADGDGPASQNHTNGLGINPELAFASPHPLSAYAVNYDRDSFDFSINERGYQEMEADNVALTANYALGQGTATYIFGYRDYYSPSFGDIDSQPFTLFHSYAWTASEQISHELRYNVPVGKADLTFGGYYYTNDLTYHERRVLPLTVVARDINGDGEADVLASGIYQDGGGNHTTDSVGIFGAVDYALTDKLMLTAGLRYTKEEKDVEIASLSANVSSINSGYLIPQGPACNIYLDNDCEFDFTDKEDWTSLSPKIGLNYRMNADTTLYANWSKGFRSGGYNLRNTADISTDELRETNGPGPFDQETVNSFEVGYKSDHDWGRLNAAAFATLIDDMQREVNLPAPDGSVIQIIKNTAEARIFGLEVDGIIRVTDNLAATFNVGLTQADYTKVLYDLNGDGMIDNEDEELDIPRVPEVTYSVGLTHDLELGDWGYMTSRASYSYRDKTYYTDNNLGYIDDQKILNAGIDFRAGDDSWVFSVFGKNLFNDVKHGGDTQLSFGTFSPLAKGRVLGVEVSYHFY